MTATDDIFSGRARELVLEKEIELQKLKNANEEDIQEKIKEVIIELKESNGTKIVDAITLGFEYGGIDGAHHKMWVIDQMLRILTGSMYDCYVVAVKDGEDGPDTYAWDEGIAP